MENQTDTENLINCPSCRAEMVAGEICPECGFEGALVEEERLEPLAIGTVLADRYEITEIHQTPQSGIQCYLALDKASEEKVLIKEAAIPKKIPPFAKGGFGFLVGGGCRKGGDFSEASESQTVDSKAKAQDDTNAETKASEALVVPSCYNFSNQEAVPTPNGDVPPEYVARTPYDRLKLEYEILKALQYPTIVKVLDTFEVENRLSLVEQYFESCTLRDAWGREETSNVQKIDWFIQLCQALAKVHSAEVLYNAVSPYRLKLSAENRLLLTDFSSACKLPLASEHQQGVDFYTAPELALNPETADVRADLYALGVTWYELLLGRRLTDDDFESHFLLKPLSEDACFTERPLHPSIHRMVLKLTHRNPDIRFATKTENPCEELRGTKQTNLLRNEDTGCLRFRDELASGQQPIAPRSQALLGNASGTYWHSRSAPRNTHLW